MLRPYFFRRNGRGGIDVCLAPEEASLLAELPGQIREAVTAERGDDPVVDRLFPGAYLDPTELGAEDEWHRLVHADLVAGKLAGFDAITAALARQVQRKGWVEVELTREEAEGWLTAINDARLVLGTRLDVTEDMDFDSFDPRDPDNVPLLVYQWLGWAQSDLVDLLAG